MPPVQSVKALRRKNGLEQDGTNLNVYPYRLDNMFLQYLTKEELELMASAETKNRLAKQAFMFACFTGLRYSDVASLMWGNIQHTSLRQEIVIDSMQKTKRSVRVPLSSIALSWLPERGNNAASQKVFAGLTSLCQTNVILKKMAKAVGINKTVSFHVSRHTFATSAIAAGGDLFTVYKLLGHKKIFRQLKSMQR